MTRFEPSDRKRLTRSVGISIALWVALSIAFVAIPLRTVEPRLKYKDLLISLEAEAPIIPEPARNEPVAQPAALPQVAKASVPSAAAAPQQPAPGKIANAKPKAASSPSIAAKPAYSSPGLGIPNFSEPIGGATASTDGADTAGSLDFSSERTAQSSSRSIASATPELVGSAAIVSAAGSGKTVSSSTQKNAVPGTASAETESSLAGIERSASTGAAASSPSNSSTTAKTGNSDRSRPATSVPGLSFSGAPRGLISPKDPSVIDLPTRLKRLVDSDRSVVVSFTVRKDGSVPAGSVAFSPQGALPIEIREWLTVYFSGWRFESGSEDGHADFRYSIKMDDENGN